MPGTPEIGDKRKGDDQKAVAPEREARWTRPVIWGTVCAVFFGIVFWIADPGTVLEQLNKKEAKDSYDNLLAQGFSAGQLNLKMAVPPEVAKLRNPYDPTVDPTSLVNVVDLSYYKGKFYMYFGVTPVVVLFWPYAVLTGHYLSDRAAIAIFFGVGFWVVAVLILDIRRRYFSQTSVWVPMTGIMALGTALVLTVWGSVYEVSITSGFAFVMLALGGIWRALHEPQKRVRWLLLASLAYGLAVGSRPSLVFGIIILLVPAVLAWREARELGSSRKIWPLLAAAAIPAMLIGSGLLLYNDLRFGNPLEFGWRYQLHNTYFRSTTVRQFSLHYLWFNIRYYFFTLFGWDRHFPFLRLVPLPPLPAGYDPGTTDACGGILSIYPALLLALAAPLAWKGRPELSALRWFTGTVFLLFVICAVTICFFFTGSVRYELDFLPTLILLAMIGILGLDRASANSPLLRRVVQGGWCALLAWSVAFNWLGTIQSRSESHSLVANGFLSEGRLDEAMTQYRKAQTLWPESADAVAGLGTVLFRKGDLDGAIAQYQKALDIQPNFAGVHDNLAYCLLQKGRVDDAIIHYQKAIEIQPASADYYDGLGDAFFRAGRANDAIVQYRKALALAPDAAPVHFALGNALSKSGQTDESILEYEKALEINPDDAEVDNNLGFAFLRAGRVDEAIQYFQRSLEIQKTYQGYYNLAYAFRQEGKAADAIASYLQVIKLQPGYVPAQVNLAWMLATWPDKALRNGNEAVTLARQASQSTTANPKTLRTLAAAYAETGQFPQAVEAAKEGLALAQSQSDNLLSNELQAEIRLYEANLPCRSTNN